MKQESKKVICDEKGCRIIEQPPARSLYQLPDGSLGDRRDMNAYDRE